MGYLIADDIVVYFPGDTKLFPEMATIAERIDVALMPVWGWGPHLGRMHMSPTKAALALAYFKPSLAIPIHWGTYPPAGMFWMKPSFHTAPPIIFTNAAGKFAANVEIMILPPGDLTEIFLWVGKAGFSSDSIENSRPMLLTLTSIQGISNNKQTDRSVLSFSTRA